MYIFVHSITYKEKLRIKSMAKRDPYNNKENYLAWKERAQGGIEGISDADRALLLKYVEDMEIGINVGNATRKGARSFIHLNSLKDRLISLMKKVRAVYGIESITDINEEQLHLLFAKMRDGTLTKPNGQPYLAVWDFVKIFKAFWHWYQRVEKKKGKDIPDITSDLDTTQEKPDWVYLTEEQVKKLAEQARADYRVLIWFLFDTGIRAPTELLNVKVSDFFNDFKELNIRQETSKTFGRRIKLMICSSLVKEFIKEKGLRQEDFLFNFQPATANKYLKRLSQRLFGNEKSPAGQKYSDLTMYDFRHISCCYWLPRYKSESALKYRFGWKKSDKIHYYSELLGMRDTISEDDLLVDVTKTEIEQRLARSEKEKEILKEKVAALELQMSVVAELTKKLEASHEKSELLRIEQVTRRGLVSTD